MSDALFPHRSLGLSAAVRRHARRLGASSVILVVAGCADAPPGATDAAPGAVDTSAREADDVGIRVTGNPHSAISALVDVTTPVDALVAVRVTGPGVDGRLTPWSALGRAHHVEVVGLRAESSYVLEVVVDRGDGAEPDVLPASTFHTGELPFDVPDYVVRTFDRAAVPDGVTVFSAWTGADGVLAEEAAFVGVDADGEVVWTWVAPGTPKPGYVEATPSGDLRIVSPDALRVVTRGGEPVSSVPVLDLLFHHDGVALPNGHQLVLGTDQRDLDVDGDRRPELVVGDYVLELDATGRVVWRWSTLDHLPTDRFPGPLSREQSRVVDGLDLTHGNALAYLADEDAFLLSLRNQHWIVKVDRASGEVLWRLGEGGDFVLAEGDVWFHGQHAPEVQPDGTLLVYDNGNERGVGPATSRAVRIAVDEVAKTADVVWEADMGVYTPQLGSALSMPGGGVLACAGAWTTEAAPDAPRSTLREIAADGRVVREIEVEGLVARATHLANFWQPR